MPELLPVMLEDAVLVGVGETELVWLEDCVPEVEAVGVLADEAVFVWLADATMARSSQQKPKLAMQL